MSDAGAGRRAGEKALALAADAGIHRISVPTPFLVGPVNCYVLEDDPLTLIDTGPNSGTALDALARGLRDLGHSLEDLGLIVLTHQHMDHIGLVEILARRSGAEVAALDELGDWVERFPETAADDDLYAQAVMRRHGVPDELVTALGMVGMAFRHFGSSGTVTRRVRDGDALTLRDRTLLVQHRPGHSPTDTLFWDREREILIVGDHLLNHISSNALVARPLGAPPDAGEARPTPLLSYVGSMRRTRELPARLTLGGHGSPITDHVPLIDDRLRLHDRRARKLGRMLTDGPLSAYEIAQRMWGNVAVTQAFLTLSEVLGHLDLLIDAGTVRERDDGPLARFELTGEPAAQG
jgi:glyoxylase-like metal-dependent hydrolase (beta-lactamase superfamily II)